jgi:hypothetical protein
VVARLTFILAIAIGLTACSPAPNRSENASSTAATSSPASLFTSQPIGDRPRKDERPQMSHVAMVDLDRDGLMDVLACDALRNVLVWVRQSPKGTFTEQTIAGVAAPAHVEAIDFDRDGDLDLIVAALGFLFPNNNRVGSVIVFENDGQQHFKSHYIADRVARVADARAADLDGDGDLDVSVAGFGYDDGETSWLENKGSWMFEQHVLQRLSGAINALPVDLNGDKSLDIVALISQEWEEIWAFVNNGKGGFTPRMLWGSTNPDFGSSWISIVDLDRDGDADILYANGDAFEYAPPNSRPWQGIQWLENTGPPTREALRRDPAVALAEAGKFAFHRIIDLQGATSPEAADLDGDGDLDVLIVTSNNDWDNPQAPSLLWLENDGHQTFTMHPIASSPTHLLTVAVGDLDGDGKPDAVTGGMHISRPYDRIGRITAWFSTRSGR